MAGLMGIGRWEAEGGPPQSSEACAMSKGSDDLIREINRSLPPRWVLNSITVTEADEYSVLLCPRGPVPVQDLGRVYGRGETVRDALANALEKLGAFLDHASSRVGNSAPNPTCPPRSGTTNRRHGRQS